MCPTSCADNCLSLSIDIFFIESFALLLLYGLSNPSAIKKSCLTLKEPKETCPFIISPVLGSTTEDP